MRPTICVHCHERPPSRARGLCARCYEDRAIRALYPPAHRFPASESCEATDAELDALIAERSKPENLPAWWYDEARRRPQSVNGVDL